MKCAKILKDYFSISTFKRNLVKACLFTLLVLSLLSQVLDLSEIVCSFLALPTLILFPILSGNALIYIVERVWIRSSKNMLSNIGLIPNLIFEWFLGLYFIYAFLFVLLLHTQNIIFAISIMVTMCWIGAWRLDLQLFSYGSTLMTRKSFLLLLTLMIIGLVPISIIKLYSTFPIPQSRAFIVGGYLYRFVYNIAERGIPDSPYDVVHPPSLNILYGLVSRMFSIDPLSLFWSVPFLLLVIQSIGMFLFAYELSGRKELALSVSVVGVWILSATNAAEWPVAPEAAYVIYALNPLIFYIFIKLSKMRQIGLSHIVFSFTLSSVFLLALKYAISVTTDYTATSPYIIFYQSLILSYLLALMLTLKIGSYYALPLTIMIALVCIHTSYVGPLTSLVSTLLFIINRLNMSDRRSFLLGTALQLSLITIASLYIGLQALNVVKIPMYNAISSLLGLGARARTFDWKFRQLIIGSSEFVFSLFFLGILSLLSSGRRQNLTVVTTTILVLLIYFLPEGFSFRALDTLAPFMAYAVASIANRCCQLLDSQNKQGT